MGCIIRSFNKKVARLHYRAHSILSNQNGATKWRHRFLVEGLVQETWQFWNTFSKDVLLASCQGYVCDDGTVMNARVADNSVERLAYVFKKGRVDCGSITAHYAQPTWGDVTKFVRAVRLLGPANERILLQSFGLNNLNQSLSDLQLIRNCMAHKSPETYSDYRGLFSGYRVTSSNVRPQDFVWLYTSSGEVAYFKWLDDMVQIASLANKSVP